jgi:hypothetical protein
VGEACFTRASASTPNVKLLTRGVGVDVLVGVEEGLGLAGSVFVAVGVRVGEGPIVLVAVCVNVAVVEGVRVGVLVVVSVAVGKGVPEVVPWQFPVPVSVNVLPASGTNCQL